MATFPNTTTPAFAAKHRFRKNLLASVALARLNDALQDSRARKHTASPSLDIDFTAEATATLSAVRGAAVDGMVAEPARIARAVYPWRPPSRPVSAKSTDGVPADCRSHIAAQKSADNVWRDGHRLMALEQAEAALVALQMREAA